jgi:hypothetical protein
MLSVAMILNVGMLSVVYSECLNSAHYSECRYAECHCAGCRYAE